jgi:RNA polymerase sigma-70 factor (ECF subfamily)
MSDIGGAGCLDSSGNRCGSPGVEHPMSRPPTLDAAPDGARAARFTTVATAVWEPLQRYLRRRAHPDDVDDIAAEALTVMWRRLDDIPTGAEIPWCYSIVRRCLANHRRGNARRRNLIQRITGRGDMSTGRTLDPSSIVDDTDPALRAALAQLSVDDRELLTLWAWEQLSVTEIAVALDANVNTISVRLRRARQRLVDHLGDSGDTTDTACHIAAPAGHTDDGRTQETPR